MAGRTTFEFELGTAPKRRRPDDEDSMRILVMGDFGGRAQRGACAEAAFADRAAEAILAAGLMPLLSRKDRNAVRLMRFQSIAHPAQALSGSWS